MARNSENQGGAGEGDPQPHRGSRRQMREDIQVLQQQVREAEEAQQRAEEENQALRAQVNQRILGATRALDTTM
ncbi:unnamed protein product [Rhizoctonia solani]|uniref:Uncharacterized protein n=1 Tax=Rhizoctonia solani TaxID=456999 RepID=A0A8H3ADF7_9AGAM|nr:unnamed protein product [Rhizoctonia solani]